MKAIELHEKAVGLAKKYLLTEGELLTLLIQMKKQRAFTELSYTGMYDYCEKALKLSPSQCYYFKTVAEKSEVVPEMKKEIEQGNLSLSQARRIAPVITPENKDLWLTKAKTLTQKELEKEVSQVNPEAKTKEKLKPLAQDIYQLSVPIDKEQNKT